MTWFFFGLFVLSICVSVYCGLLFLHLWGIGLIKGDRRMGLAKLNRALNAAQNPADKKFVVYAKKWYIVYLILFYTSIAGFLLSMIFANRSGASAAS